MRKTNRDVIGTGVYWDSATQKSKSQIISVYSDKIPIFVSGFEPFIMSFCRHRPKYDVTHADVQIVIEFGVEFNIPNTSTVDQCEMTWVFHKSIQQTGQFFTLVFIISYKQLHTFQLLYLIFTKWVKFTCCI